MRGTVAEEAARVVSSVLESAPTCRPGQLLRAIDGKAPSFLASAGLEALSFEGLVDGLVAATLRVRCGTGRRCS